MANNFLWGSNVTGSWDDPANWNDTTTGESPASVAPGSTDAVTINAADGITYIITGTGDAASLTIGGATALQGQFTTGALVLQDNASSSIGLPSNSSLTVNGSVTGNDGSSIAVNGGQLTIGGSITTGLNVSSGTVAIQGNMDNNGISISGGTISIAGSITNNDDDVSGGTILITGNITNDIAEDNLSVQGGETLITGSITNNYLFDSLNVSGGTVAIVGSVTNNYLFDSLNVSGGTAAIVGSVTNNSYSDTINVSGGTLTVGGTVTDQGNSDYLAVYNGGSAQFGGLTQSSGGGVFNGVYVDSTSVLEIGATGDAAIGSLTIDSGVTVTGSNSGYFQAPSIVDDGVINVTRGSFSLYGNLTGSGAVDIDSGANAIITGVDGASANTVAFTSVHGVLTVDSSALNASQAFTPAVSGFNQTDIIDVQGTVTAANYDNGVLTLTDGASTVAELTLDGNFTAEAFNATPIGNGYTQIAIVPGAPIISGISPDTGVSATDGITNQSVVSVSGIAEPDTTVILYNGTSVTGTASADNTGAWTVNNVSLAEGANNLTATATDASGYTGAISEAVVTLDTLPPTVAISTPGGTIFGASQTIAGTVTAIEADPASTVTLYDNSSPTPFAMATVQKDGSWSVGVTLASGTNSIVAEDTDAAGNTGRSGPVVVTFDTPALVTSVVAAPSSGVEQVGSVVTMAVTFTKAVTVTGTPTLTLNDGGSAAYQGTSPDGKTLTFAYKVGAGDTSVPALAVTVLNVGGATITDSAGQAANISGAAQTFAGLQVDTVTPVIMQVLTSSASNDVGLGQTVTVTLDFSKSVAVKGTPKLILNDGGIATYAGGSGTSALTFSYKVAAGQNTTDLQATGITLPTGASIKDSTGHAANLAGAKTDLGLQIDSIPPVISAISSDPGSGDLNAGKTVAISLAMSEPVVVTGTPALLLNDGGTATFDAANSTQTTLVFAYTVALGQNTSALKITELNMAGASIKDLAGNSVTATLPASAALGLQIDTKAPTVTSASAAASSTDLNAGKTAEITLVISEPVTVSGNTALSLNDGGTATYDAALSSATALTFDYTVQAGENTTGLKGTGLAVGSIQDLAGNALAKVPAANLGLQVDTLTPAVSGVTASRPQGTGVGDPIAITLKMNEAVTVSGTPEVLLSNGGIATYNASASTAKALVFDTAVGANQGTGTAPLSIVGVQLDSPDAIQDGAGNFGALTLSSTETNLGFKISSTPAGSASAITLSGTQEAEIFGPSSQNVSFASGADGTLKLDAATAYSGSVSGLALGDTLDFSNLAYGPNMTTGYSGNATGGVLSVSNGANTADIALFGNFTASTFTLGSDGHGGTTVVDPPMIAAAPSLATKHA